jgi:hypothetical protein
MCFSVIIVDQGNCKIKAIALTDLTFKPNLPTMRLNRHEMFAQIVLGARRCDLSP